MRSTVAGVKHRLASIFSGCKWHMADIGAVEL